MNDNYFGGDDMVLGGNRGEISHRQQGIKGGGGGNGELTVNQLPMRKGVHKILQGPGGREQVNFIVTHLNPPKPTPSPLLRQ